MLAYAAVGLAIGLVSAAPVGPVNLLVFRVAALRGAAAGFLTGAASTVADMMFAGAAIFGVGAVSLFMEEHHDSVALVGGLAMIGFGIGVLVSHPHPPPGKAAPMGRVAADAASAFVLTITNPAAILGFAAMIGGLGHFAPPPEDPGAGAAMLAGIVAGSLAWWLMLSQLVARYRSRIGEGTLERANRWVGVAILLVGAVVLGDLALQRFG